MPEEQLSEEDELFPIPLAIMQPGTAAPVNLYIQVAPPSGFILYKAAHTSLSEVARERLIERDFKNLFVREQDQDAYYLYLEQHIDAILKDGLLPSDSACRIVYEGSSRVAADLLEDPRSGRNFRRAGKMVKATVHTILNDPEALWRMTTIASHDYRTYTHCVNVCMFMVAAAREVLGISDRAALGRIGLGGIFHDVGKSEVPEEVLNKSGPLSDREWELVKQHPALGVRIVTRFQDVPAVVTDVVKSHHERMEGGGYPDGCTADRLSRVSRLAGIVDAYDALTSERPYGPARKPFEALSLMKEEIPEHFDGPLLHRFVRFLGPRDARGEDG